MKVRVLFAWSRCRAALRRWLRFTWLGRVPQFGPRPWFAARSRRRGGEPPRIFHPTLEALENRWTPDDILGASSAPLSIGGLVLLAGSRFTPMRMLLTGAPPAPAVEPASPPDTSASPYRFTSEDDPLFTGGEFDDLAFVATLGQSLPNSGM